MLSKYFLAKTKLDEFKNHLEILLSEISGKRILLYGAGEGFIELNKRFDLIKKLDIVAIADKKFENANVKSFLNLKAISPEKITEENYDYILVTNEYTAPILNYLFVKVGICEEKIKTVFVEDIKEERANLNYLFKHKFDKTLPKLIKKLKNKKVVFYGAGIYLEVIKKYFDISGINVIGIADKKFEIYCQNEEFLGYKTIAPSDIENIKPDYVIVTTKNYISIIEDLYFDLLKGKKIKIKPLVKKSFITLVKEIWAL